MTKNNDTEKIENNRVSIKENASTIKNSATQSQITKKQPSVSPPNGKETKLQSASAHIID